MIEEAEKTLTEFKAKHARDLEIIRSMSESLRKACAEIERSWSRSFAGWHGTMYFRNFEIPSVYERFNGEWGGINGIPPGWEEKQPEEVRQKIEQLVGNSFSVDKLDEDIKKLRKEADTLKSELDLLFGSLDLARLSSKEKKTLEGIETFSFGKTKGEFIRDGLPKTLMSRDSEALRQGTCVPAWLYYDGVACEGITLTEAITNFIGVAERVIKSIQRSGKGTPAVATVKETIISLQDLHPDIYEKCHELYEKKIYPEAVEKSFKVVRDRLRKLTGYETGADAFGRGKLHVEGAAAPNVEQDFNDAVKFLTMAIDRFRNEKSHTSDSKIADPIRAYEYLQLSSLAMHLLEKTSINP